MRFLSISVDGTKRRTYARTRTRAFKDTTKRVLAEKTDKYGGQKKYSEKIFSPLIAQPQPAFIQPRGNEKMNKRVAN